jgi:hypothetical protein
MCSIQAVGAVALVLIAVTAEGADEHAKINSTSKTENSVVQAAVPREKLRYAGRSFEDLRDQLLNDLDAATCKQAMAPLAAFARNGYAEEAAAALARRLCDDRDEVADEAKSLAKVGSEAVPILTEGLANERAHVRAQSAYALAAIGAAAQPAMTALLGLLSDEDDEVRTATVQAVAALAGDDDAVRATVERVLASEDVPVRSAFVAGLAANPPPGGWRLTLLMRLAEDDSEQVRAAAGQLLAIAGPAKPEVAAALKRLLKDGEQRARRPTLEALVSRGNGATKIPVLVEALVAEDDGEHLRQNGYGLRAINALGGAADQAEIAVPALIKLVDGKVPNTGPKELLGAIDALGKLGPRAKRAVPALERCIFDDKAVNFGNGDLVQKHAQRAVRRIAASLGEPSNIE